MAFDFLPQCCDATHYLEIGERCAKDLADCWNPLRPAGATLYFSLPFRLGVKPQLLIILNFLFLFGSLVAGWFALAALAPQERRGTALYRAAVLVLVHVWFMYAAAWSALSDVPAASLVLITIWLLILAVVRGGRAHAAGAGLALGLAVVLRAYYLYPAALLAGAWLLLSLVVRRRRGAALLFLLLTAAPVFGQFALTHSRTKVWSFIAPGQTASNQQLHFGSVLSGYDTVARPWPGYGLKFDASSCFTRSSHLLDALHKRDLAAVGCLLLRRQYFYFASYTRWGAVYLTSPAQRHESVFYLILNLLLAGLFIGQGILHRRREAMIGPAILLAAIWGQGSLIIPETRFFMVLQVVLWTVALCALPGLIERFGGLKAMAERLRRLRPGRAGASKAGAG